MQGLGWLTTQTATMRPVWTLFHVAAMVLGLTLLLLARQPVWLDATARRVWGKVRALNAAWGRGAPLAIGALWAFMPCGLLYSALLVAALSGGPLDGAQTMALFALGSSVSLLLGPWFLLRLGRGGNSEWGMRLAGLALAVTSGWALWMGLAHDTAPWCIAP
jgi:sulfite exporter TauE/SafE